MVHFLFNKYVYFLIKIPSNFILEHYYGLGQFSSYVLKYVFEIRIKLLKVW